VFSFTAPMSRRSRLTLDCVAGKPSARSNSTSSAWRFTACCSSSRAMTRRRSRCSTMALGMAGRGRRVNKVAHSIAHMRKVKRHRNGAGTMEQELEFVERQVGATADLTVIWLHGLGADGYDFVPLVPEL